MPIWRRDDSLCRRSSFGMLLRVTLRALLRSLDVVRMREHVGTSALCSGGDALGSRLQKDLVVLFYGIYNLGCQT